MVDSQYSFGGRLRAKQNEPTTWENLVNLPCEKMAFIYQRLSKHEQVKRNIYSLKAQDALVDLAKEDGYSDHLVYVGKRDLGISGTKGREDRPELAYLIEQVEAGALESVYVVHISRLYRDQTLINALALGELFKEYGVIIVTPQMRLNLKDKMHMRLYRMEVERAADELELMAHRLLGAQALKAKSGLYAGENLPPGIIVDEREKLADGAPNPDFHTYQEYPPHADVVRTIFNRLTIPGQTPTKVVRYCRRQGIVFAPFSPELSTPANLKGFLKSKTNPDGSWPVTVGRVRCIATNPAYIGWKVWAGELIDKEVYDPLIDEQTFWAVQERFGTHESPKEYDPLPLAGLLYCGKHDVPKRMYYDNRQPACGSVYHCQNQALGSHCTSITVHFLDNPISEAVISQSAVPGMIDRTLRKLTDEYEQAKAQAASYRREMKRLETEIENLRSNLITRVMSADQLKWLDQEIQKRLARIQELADLESQPIGVAVGQAIPGQKDIEMVKSFLEGLGDKWASLPNGLKNAFLRLLLDKVIIWPEPEEIRVRLYWRFGPEQELLIRRPCQGLRKRWTEAEVDILRKCFETTDRKELMKMLPGRSWRAITSRGNELGLTRTKFTGNPGEKAAPYYTSDEDELVRRYYAGEISLDEAMSTGRSFRSIRGRATLLGLKRRTTWQWVETNGQTWKGESSPMRDVGKSVH